MKPYRKAFTLVELAIVLIVIGILTGGGVKMMGVLAKKAKVLETKEKMQAMQETILGFTLQHQRLPTSQEWKNLFHHTEDSWGKTIQYIVDPRLTQEKNMCHLKTSPLTLDLGDQEQTNLAFVLLSAGPNRNIQTSIDNLKLQAEALAKQTDRYESDFIRKESFDDRIMSYSIHRLHYLSMCEDVKLHILNDTLPRAVQNMSYDAEIFAQGGASFSNKQYRWCASSQSKKVLRGHKLLFLPALPSCDQPSSVWRQTSSLRLKSLKVSNQQQGTLRIDMGVSDRYNNQKFKSLILNVEQGR